MTATATEAGPVRPVFDARRWAVKYWPVLAGVAALAALMAYQRFGADAPVTAPSTVVVEREPVPPPEPAPKLDPLAGFSKPLAPVAMALVGSVYGDRAELARRMNELFGQGLNDCQVFIGSDGVAWSVSAVWSAGHPSPIFAGCPWPPPVVAR